MPKIPVKDVLVLLFNLQHQQEAQQHDITTAGLDRQLSLLRAWQSARLRQTYADLLANDKYRPACQFFLSDIYAARDFSQRDYDAERLYQILSRYLPGNSLYLLAKAIQINQLTNALDHDLLNILVNRLGVEDSITPEQYAEGYKFCDNYEARKQQIELLVDILQEAGKVARNPLVGFASRLARIPARNAGWFEIYDFLERGYAALSHMRDVRRFAEIIKSRETRILDQIYANHPRPFEI